MRFTEQELICLNSVLKESEIFGINLSAPKEPGAEYVTETLKSMRDKGRNCYTQIAELENGTFKAWEFSGPIYSVDSKTGKIIERIGIGR